MDSSTLDPHEVIDLIFYEAEAPDGFLSGVKNHQIFDATRWQQLWDAAASLFVQLHGEFDAWTNFDLNRIIQTVQAEGQHLAGRTYETLNEYERAILEANLFLADIVRLEE